MRTTTLLLLSAFTLACREEGSTKFLQDVDEDGVNENDDCDDEDPRIGAAVTYYADADKDGHGDPSSGDSACTRPEGYAEVGDDCDDGNAAIFPGADDVCDKLDNDCDGIVDNGLESTAWYTDGDRDGYGDDATILYDCTQPDGLVDQGGDCNDADAAYNPGATEEDCEDPNDYNCDGSVGFADNDADGFAACEECDDGDAAVNPGASEVCDGIDDDCDGLVDDADYPVDTTDGTLVYADLDGDGFGDPTSPATYCDPGPGWVQDNTDCDDARFDINPGVTEVCNGTDDDCDGLVDDADDSLDVTSGAMWYADADGDGYGDDAVATYACEAPVGAVALGGDCNDADTAYNPAAVESDCTDPNDYNCDGSTGAVDGDGDGFVACEECDDTNAAVHPGAAEVCDGVDDNCDGVVDEATAVDAATWYADVDGDTFGDSGSTALGCSAPAGYVADATDCDDAAVDVNPAQTELCNGVDDDCDGAIDEAGAGGATNWYADADGDSYGDAGVSVTSCMAPAGYVSDGTDCDDTDAAVSPAATEFCNGIDDNCDGAIDEDAAADAATWYADADGDTYGDASSSVVDCDQPAGYVSDTTDCVDSNASIHPGAVETCDSVDQDCDGIVDDEAVDAGLWYADADGDTYGDDASVAKSCSAPAGYVADNADCDDTDASVNPAGAEVCNSIDDDCNGLVDDGVGSTWYGDADGDGYGDAGLTTTSCSLPAGFSADSTDCDDTRASVHPLATESCNGLDDDCDGSVDEAGSTGSTTWYADTDGDGYGDASVSTASCSAPVGYVASSTDCEDGDAAISPADAEVCDTVDNNCDGNKDEGSVCPCTTDEYGGHAYMFCTSGLAVAAARTSCLTYGYDLVAINDDPENTWVASTAYTLYLGKWWTGYADTVTEGTWFWSNGDTSTYTNWHSGEPNDSGHNEDCMQLGRWTTDYSWNDETCTDTFRYICEE